MDPKGKELDTYRKMYIHRYRKVTDVLNKQHPDYFTCLIYENICPES
jgi:hypothetical protein